MASLEITKPRTELDAIVERIPDPVYQPITPEQSAILLPPGWRAETQDIDLSTVDPQPARRTGTVDLLDPESYIAFVASYTAQPGETPRIYVATDYILGSVNFIAVLNDHGDGPQWRDYRVNFQPRPSIEWTTWRLHSAQEMSQSAFAVFLEDNAKDIATVEGLPTSAQMLQMALNFESTAEARIKSSVRLQSGTVAFSYTDAEDDATLKRMEMFGRFAIGIPAFYNGTPYRIDARLRYRNSAGKLTFWYELIRADLVLQDATRDLIKSIRDALPAVPVLMGVP